MMSTYNLTIANPAMAPRVDGRIAPLDPPLYPPTYFRYIIQIFRGKDRRKKPFNILHINSS